MQLGNLIIPLEKEIGNEKRKINENVKNKQ